MSRSDSQATFVPVAGLRTISGAPRSLIPLMVINVELKWKFRCPWMHRLRQGQLLRGASFPNVAVSLANLPKYLVSSLNLWAWVARKVKNAMSDLATSR